MLKVDIKIDKSGIQKLNTKTFQLAIDGGIRDTIIFMEGVGIKVTPIRTGFLRKGFKSKFFKGKAKFYNDVKYAKFVNFGTKYQKANPFMENIVKETEKEVEKIFIRNFKKVLG